MTVPTRLTRIAQVRVLGIKRRRDFGGSRSPRLPEEVQAMNYLDLGIVRAQARCRFRFVIKNSMLERMKQTFAWHIDARGTIRICRCCKL